MGRDEEITIKIRRPGTKESITISDFSQQLDIKDKYMVKAKVTFKNGDVFHICFRNINNVSIKTMRNTGLFTRFG